MKALNLLLLLFILPLQSFSQQKKHTTFTFLSVKNALDKRDENRYDSMKISVNNMKLSEKNKLYNVYLNYTGLDVIKVQGYSSPDDTAITTIYAKLKAGEHYTINYNACSGYEIGPLKRNPKTRLIRLVVENNDKKKRYFSSDYCFINTDTLQNADTTYYYQNHISGYCEFATTSAGICKSDPENYKIKDTCIWVNIQFFDAEKYSIIYDCKTQKISAKFEGYYDEKKDKVAEDYVPK